MRRAIGGVALYGPFVRSRRGFTKQLHVKFSQSFSSWTDVVTKTYDAKVDAGLIKDDDAQRVALKHFDRLYKDLMEFDEIRENALAKYQEARKARKELETELHELETKSWVSSLFSASDSDKERLKKELGKPLPRVVEAPRGLYLHGGPGSGKTFTMELFHEVLPLEGKRRIHFHEFMLNVHRMLHSMQQYGYKSEEMMDRCVESLYKESWVLCFDEFQVTDIADAMIIRRLFDALLARGMVVVITSNREPDELYKNGIQRNLFVPFIEDIKKLFDVVNVQSDVDYRMLSVNELAQASRTAVDKQQQQQEDSSVYFVSQGGLGALAKYERLFEKLTKKDIIYDSTLTVQGRKIRVPRAARHADVARFDFDDLCGKPMGAADYYAIASTFHTIFIDDIPQLRLNMINQIRRFITMIDTFYEHKVVVIMSSNFPMESLLDRESMTATKTKTHPDPANDEEDGNVDDVAKRYVASDSNIDEVFAFDRTLSRLHEMQRQDYLLHSRKRSEGGSSPVRFLSQFEHHALSEGDIKRLWQRYDKNSDGVIDKQELKKMLEEITLFKSGHRHIPEEVFEATRVALTNPQSKRIEWETFHHYFSSYGLDVSKKTI